MAYNLEEQKKLARLKEFLEKVADRAYTQATWERLRREVRKQSKCESYFSVQFENALKVYGYAVKVTRVLGIPKSQINEMKSQVMEVVEKGATKITCEDYYQHLCRELKINPPRTTKYRFFKSIGGFMKNRPIEKDNKILVTYKAILWANKRNIVPENITPDLKGVIQNVK